MYLAILAKTDGRIGGFTPSDKTTNLGINVHSHEVAKNLVAGYFYSKNEIPNDYIEEMLTNIENSEHVQEVEIMKYIER